VKIDLLSVASVNGMLISARGASSVRLAEALAQPPEVAAARYEIRRRYAAVMVGTGTVLADDPTLTSHATAGFTPVRVTLDRRGRIPPGARFLDGAARTLIAVCRATPRAYLDLLAARGIETIDATPASEGAGGGRIDLARLIAELAARGIAPVVAEGGGTLARGLLQAGLLDRLHLFVMPAVLDAGAVNLFEGGRGTLARLELEATGAVGGYALLRYRVGGSTPVEPGAPPATETAPYRGSG
jgi:riboflavin-specific deaminase-like protein